MPFGIIVDLDSTLFDINHRLKYIDGSLGKKDWDNFYSEIPKDTVNPWCADILYAYHQMNMKGHPVHVMRTFLFITGRPERTRRDSIESIEKRGGIPVLNGYSKLYMREDEDFRPGYQVKREIYRDCVQNSYDILFCLEDNPQCVQMWREEGLDCLQIHAPINEESRKETVNPEPGV